MTAPAAGESLLGGHLPPEVALVESFADPRPAALFPEEAEVVARAVEKRRREFSAVRACARAALAKVGIPPIPILPTGEGPGWASGAPRWPAGIVGSMTHCDGYRAAAVAHAAIITSLGIDAEPHGPLPWGTEETVARPEERRLLARLAVSHPGTHWDRLLFSAKESASKAWFPLTRRWLDFDDCAISVDPDGGTFAADLRVPGLIVQGRRINRFTGIWRVLNRDGQGYVATAVIVTPPTEVVSWEDDHSATSGERVPDLEGGGVECRIGRIGHPVTRLDGTELRSDDQPPHNPVWHDNALGSSGGSRGERHVSR
nr:4'-phosphopantetheinyl transferase superfamily protein [Frankia sp. Cas3]